MRTKSSKEEQSDSPEKRTRQVNREIAVFFILACVFGWIFYALHALGLDSTDPGNLPLGPLVAALLVAAIMGRTGLREWWQHLSTLRTRPGWYALAVVAPLVIIVSAVLANYALGTPLPTASQMAVWPELSVTFLFLLLFVGIGEEAGWTAFAAPRLLGRYSFVKSFALLSAMRIFWHLPLMLTGDLPLALGVGGNIGFQFLVLWVFYRTDVWFLAAVWHAVVNTTGGEFFFTMVDGADQTRLGVLMSLMYLLVAGAVYLAMRRRPEQIGALEEQPEG